MYKETLDLVANANIAVPVKFLRNLENSFTRISPSKQFSPRRPRMVVSARKALFSWGVNIISISKDFKVETRLTVSAGCRRSRVVRYLSLKWLYGQLSDKESFLLWNLPEILNDNSLIALMLLAKARGFSIVIIRKAAEFTTPFSYWRPASLKEWYGLKNSIRPQIVETSRKVPLLPNTNEYTGWRRHHNDKGSIRPDSFKSDQPEYLDPIFETNISDMFLAICEAYRLNFNSKVSFNIDLEVKP